MILLRWRIAFLAVTIIGGLTSFPIDGIAADKSERIENGTFYVVADGKIDNKVPEKGPVIRHDPRDIRNGYRIPDEGYCDQPYVVVTPDGNWLCTLTTGAGNEGAGGQHVVSTISKDQGKTWSKLVDIEPATGPAASWVVPVTTPNGRVYAFYTYNGDHVEMLDNKKIRNDMLGWFCYRYSDDYGQSWSKERYRLPMRLTACDHTNDWKDKVIIFWGICKPLISDEKVYFSFTKLGRYLLEQGEGWLYCSDNLLTQPDPNKIHWDMRPTGDHGIRKEEFGSVQEEHNLVSLGGEKLYCVYRTTNGFPCHTYSDDGGRTWLEPEPMTYTPDGQQVKTSRACPKVWRCENGNYLFWFHNHSGKSFEGRNPAWISGGVLRDGRIHWSQPEILLYDKDVNIRMSYPDLIEQDGKYWVTETQKTIARIHQLDKNLLEGMWNQFTNKKVTRKGLVLDADSKALSDGEADLPTTLNASANGGITIDLWLRLENLDAGQTILDYRNENGQGIALTTADAESLRLELSDSDNQAAWQCDPGLLFEGKWHHITAIVDDGPKIIMFVVDGVLCDGGAARQYGWGRYTNHLGDLSGSKKFHLGSSLQGQVGRLRVYSRPLRTSEAVGNFQAGR